MKLDTLFENYDLLMDSPNSTVKIRKLILQFAVQGKLVEQDPTDEPAGELLKRIKAEKEKLIAEGKIKKTKPLPPITEDEIPYELPQDWEWVRMKKIAYNMGQKKPDKRFTYIDVTAINKEKGTISNQVKILEPSEAPSRARKIVQKETVIYSTVRPYLLNVAIVDKEFEPEPIVSTAFAILNPYKNIYYKYLYYFLRSKIMIDYVESKMIGMAYPAINDTQFLKAPFPLPPLAEQKRIVAKVDQLMQLCDQLDACQKKASTKYESLNDAALERLLFSKTIDEFANYWQFICNNFDLIYNDPAHVNKLRQAILQLAVQGKLVPQNPKDEPASVLLEKIKSEKEKLIKAKTFQKPKTVPSIEAKNIPYKAPLNWEWKKVIDLCFVTKLAGFEYTKYVSLADSGEIPVIRAQNVKKNNINESNLKYIDMKTSKLLDRCALDRPAILMTFIGAGIGDTAIFDKKERWHLAPNVAKLVPFNYYSEKLDICYIQYYLMSNIGGSEIFKHKKSTAQPSLSMNTIRDILIIIPPLKEQHRIVAKVDQLMQLCNELENRLKQSKKDSEMLMQAVLYEAFS